MIRTLTVVACTGSVGLAVVAPAMMSVVGTEYRDQAQGLLYLAAIFVPLAAVSAVYEGVARVQRRLRLLLGVRCVATAVIICGSYIGTQWIGVSGVGWAYVVSESLAAAVLIGPVILWIRRARSGKEVVHQ
jgi:O-antigen/teichoic acid export membrane protein